MKVINGLVAVALAAVLSGCTESDTEVQREVQRDNTDVDYPLDTHQKKVSYLLGRDTAVEWVAKGVALDPESFALAVRDVLAERDVRLSDEEIAKTVETVRQDLLVRQQEQLKQQQELQAKMDEQFDKQAEENLKAGEAFLAENAKKEGVVALDSGLQYRVITAGTGSKPSATDSVEVHYRGTFLDGTEFDSSHKNGEPVNFTLDAVIAGWTEALKLMSEGAKWEVYVPGDLGYGPGGFGQIGPNATLIFEIELLAVNKAEQPEG